jgi:hypothetical protein
MQVCVCECAQSIRKGVCVSELERGQEKEREPDIGYCELGQVK